MTVRRLFYLCEIGARLDSGMTLQVAHDYSGLSRRGWSVALPVHAEDPAQWASFARFLKERGEAQAVAMRARWRAARTAAAMLAALRHRPNVVVIRERRHLRAGRLVRRLSGAALISELHESAFPSDDEPGRRRFAAFLAGLDGLVLTNASQRDYLRQLGFTLPREHIVLPNGVDFERFSRASPAAEGAPFVLTYTGQFTGWKNFELLFAALAHLDGRFRLRVAGGKAGDESARRVAGLIRQYNVEGRVDYLGFIHPEEIVARALSGSAVLLLPLGDNTISRHATSPMKLVEYLATGIPVVAVGHPSVKALAGDVVHCAAGDAGAFAAAIRAAVGEAAPARSRRTEQMKTLAAQFDHARRAQRFDAWLARLGPR